MYIPESIYPYIKNKSFTLDTKGKSGATILMFPDMVLKIEDDTEEVDRDEVMASWLSGRLNVPSTIISVKEKGKKYRLMERIEGEDLSSPKLLSMPKKIVDIVSKSLLSFWSLDISSCPVKRSLDIVLKEAEESVENNLVDSDAPIFKDIHFSSPYVLLKWLKENKVDEEGCFSHGDFCLPNILVSEEGSVGFIDLSRSGVGDKWNDIALIYRSLEMNYKGYYNGGVPYSGYDSSMLFDALGIKEDKERIRYFILLDELF